VPESCLLLKDVKGIMTGDPRVVKKPRKIDRIGFEECMEMAVQGAKRPSGRSVELAARYNIPLYVGSVFLKKRKGTWVMSNPVTEGLIIKLWCTIQRWQRWSCWSPGRRALAARLFTSLARTARGA
jgi:aspartate kinase